MSFLRRFTYTQHLSIIMIHRVTEERKRTQVNAYIREEMYLWAGWGCFGRGRQKGTL